MGYASLAMRLLTARQQEVFDFINERIRTCGYAPTIREIGAHLGIRSTNGVADHIKALKRKGVLVQEACKSRTLQPVMEEGARLGARRGRPSSAAPVRHRNTVSVPLLGRVAGGSPMLAEEHAEAVLEVDRGMLPVRGAVFALKVVGNSMVDAGIADGDTIFVQKATQASRGSIVVVLLDNEATVKRYYPERRRLVLRAANPSFADLVVPAAAARQIRLLGLVIGVFRRFGPAR